MNYSKLREIFENNTGVSSEVDDAQLALWFNEAQLDLSYELGALSSYTYTAVSDATYDLPIDCLKITGCTSNYFIDGAGKIQFSDEGSVTLYYRKIPIDFTGTATETSELHQAVHHLLPMFASSRYWLKESEGDSEELNLSNYWMSLYTQNKTLAINKLSAVASSPTAWTIE